MPLAVRRHNQSSGTGIRLRTTPFQTAASACARLAPGGLLLGSRAHGQDRL